MASYAALASLMHTIQQIQNHPCPPISLDKRQADSLSERVAFLQEFLESYSIHGGSREDAECLERRVAGAAYIAEDIIESHVVDQLQATEPDSATHEKKKFSFTRCFRGISKATSREGSFSPIGSCQALEKVIQDLDSITRDAMEIRKEKGIRFEKNYPSPASRPIYSAASHDPMVGLDDALVEAMDKLTGQQSGSPIITIVGMGGIGKTTFARNIYSKPLIVQHFDFRGWATISQQYDSKEILLELLFCIKAIGSRESLRQMQEHELGDMLYKSLSGRRYLIVMDDIWSIEAWDRVKFFFPDSSNGSRIVITTRLSNLASALSSSYSLEMGFQDEDNSWNLFRKSVFGKQNCPPGMEEIGKQIARNCRGLPLSIVVVGGLLAKSDQTREIWQYIAENLNHIVNTEDRESCLNTLLLSYNHLPVHLKSCFLYMGLFPEDHKIRASTLIKLWVAEGLLKPISNKTLEEAGEEYLKDLVQRNLILVHELGYDGNIKNCSIHDLLRDLCMKVAEKDKFFRIAHTSCSSLYNTVPSATLARSLIHELGYDGNIKNCSIHDLLRDLCMKVAEKDKLFRIAHTSCSSLYNTVPSATLARSLTQDDNKVTPASDSRLLRLFHIVKPIFPEVEYPLEDIFRAINLRHLAVPARLPNQGQFPSLCYRLWNLQTLIVYPMGWDCASTPPLINIWRMPRLRHIKLLKFRLPDPRDDSTVLWDLQTLRRVYNFDCCEEVVRRIPNIRKLKLLYYSSRDNYCLDNLCYLDKLESLFCSFYSSKSPSPINRHRLTLCLPNSLKKLTLKGTLFLWEHLAATVGHLPCLMVLNLRWFSFIGSALETEEGQFRSLRLLEIKSCDDLKRWTTADWAHIPCLDRLVLKNLGNLKAIPLEIGDIPTLKSIELDNCGESLVMSAKEIAKIQEDLGNEGLRVRVKRYGKNPVVERMASPNFQVVIL